MTKCVVSGEEDNLVESHLFFISILSSLLFVSTVTASTTYLISVPGQKSAKVKAAQEFGIPILTPHWLLDSMEEGVQKEIDGYSLFLPPSTSVAADDDEEMEESEEEEEKKSSPPTRKRMAQDSNTRPSKKAKTVPAASAQDDDDEDEPGLPSLFSESIPSHHSMLAGASFHLIPPVIVFQS